MTVSILDILLSIGYCLVGAVASAILVIVCCIIGLFVYKFIDISFRRRKNGKQ